MSFAIFDAVSGGSQKWSEAQGSVVVDKGIFNVLLGSVTAIPDSVFLNGTSRYLQLTVAGQVLSPRTRIVSAAYAYTSTYSDTAQYSRNITPDNDWSFRITDGADTTLQMGGRWGIARSGNTLYGNADSTHVVFGNANTTGTSGQNYKYCTVGGGQGNTASDSFTTVTGGYWNNAGGAYATVCGGSSNSAESGGATVGGGRWNAASDSFAIVGGGRQNQANEKYATISGGQQNAANGQHSTVAGGFINIVGSIGATVGGGYINRADSSCGTVSGGYLNIVSGTFGSVGGGESNCAKGRSSTVAGGYADTAYGFYTVVPGGMHNIAGDSCSFAAGRDVRVNGKYTFAFGRNFSASTSNTVVFHNTVNPIKVGIGTNNPDTTLHIAGYIKIQNPTQGAGKVLTSDASGVGSWQLPSGYGGWNFRITDSADTTLMTGSRWGIARAGNTLWGNADSTHVNLGVASTTGTNGQDYKYCTVGGGQSNAARSTHATVAGGYNNSADSVYATVGGGCANVTTGRYATVGGGCLNTANKNSATVGGGSINRADSSYSTVSGGASNTAGGFAATVAGGFQNIANVEYAAIGGGYDNVTNGHSATIAGGQSNVASGYYATVGGGSNNASNVQYSTVSGGGFNSADHEYATVSGGINNNTSGYCSTIGGGRANSAAASYSTIVGGYADTITTAAAYSYLFGINSNLTQDSTFMVDMPHIRFGKESNGYEFPAFDGSANQTLATNGSGQLSWTNSPADTDWVITGADMHSGVSGNVGIGTSTPVEKLHVDGEAISTVGNDTFYMVPKGGIIMWSGPIDSIPVGWALCNGANGTPDLSNRFIVSAGAAYAIGDTGGVDSCSLTINGLPSHDHGGSVDGTTNSSGTHNHTMTIRSGDATTTVIGQGNIGGIIGTGTVNNSGSHTHTFTATVSAQGGGHAHENRPRYYALAFIMRT